MFKIFYHYYLRSTLWLHESSWSLSSISSNTFIYLDVPFHCIDVNNWYGMNVYSTISLLAVSLFSVKAIFVLHLIGFTEALSPCFPDITSFAVQSSIRTTLSLWTKHYHCCLGGLHELWIVWFPFLLFFSWLSFFFKEIFHFTARYFSFEVHWRKKVSCRTCSGMGLRPR